jgi:hypothetical protein
LLGTAFWILAPGGLILDALGHGRWAWWMRVRHLWWWSATIVVVVGSLIAGLDTIRAVVSGRHQWWELAIGIPLNALFTVWITLGCYRRTQAPLRSSSAADTRGLRD